jgi:twitching motility protein PilT
LVQVADIHELLRYLVEHKGSDLHMKGGGPPSIRVSGLLQKTEFPAMDPAACATAANELMNDEQVAELTKMGEVDFAYSEPGVGRFRVNIHRQRGSVGIAARLVLPGAPSFSELMLPPVVEQLANEHRGLLLVTGPTSSGKTTTTGAILNHINATRACHILTIEDPIEILHRDIKADVTQREIGQDTTTFAKALRAAMRQDPDVIFVGEIRDFDTVSAAIQAAETGHFVLATLHTTNVSETITRVIDFFPPHQAQQVRVALAGSLQGIVSQRLLPRKGGGRAAAIEVMVSNGRVRDLILDPEKTHELQDLVAEGSYYGMQTFDQALISLYQAGLVELEDARSASTNPHDFELVLQQAGMQLV